MMSDSKPKIGLIATTSIVVGNMIASALFMLPTTLASYGSISLIGWIVSSVGAFSLAMVYAWLGKIYPVANGGPYAYTREGLGHFGSFLVAWGYWTSIWSTNAAIAIAFISYMSVFIPELATNPILSVAFGIATIWLLTWINSRGIRDAGFVQVITTILKLAPLLLIGIGGLFYMNTENFKAYNVSGMSDLQAITSTATLTLFAFLGLECATIPSGNVENPERTVPQATLWGTGIVTLVYIIGTISVMGLLPIDMLKNSNAPFADAAESIWGEGARYWVGAGAAVSAFGALNGWILMQGQIPAAAADDRLLPAFFGKLNKKFVPVPSLVISSIFVSVLIMLNFSRSLADTYKFIILLSTFSVLIAYLFSMASYLKILWEQKLKPAVKNFRLVVTFIAFGYSMWAVVGSGQEAVFWGFILLMAGVPFYSFMKIKS